MNKTNQKSSSVAMIVLTSFMCILGIVGKSPHLILMGAGLGVGTIVQTKKNSSEEK